MQNINYGGKTSWYVEQKSSAGFPFLDLCLKEDSILAHVGLLLTKEEKATILICYAQLSMINQRIFI